MEDSDDDFSFFRRAPPPPSPLTLVAFYDGSGTDGRGRKLADILQWGTGRLESSHDYIQTLFPLPEKSGVNARAPIINKEVFLAFRSRQELRDKLKDAFKRMLWFYGFEMVEDHGKITASPVKQSNVEMCLMHDQIKPSSNIEKHSQFWNCRFDHNHLRITRIIRSSRVLGLENEALAFYDAISCFDSSVSERSLMYWNRAARKFGEYTRV
jgi:hypothetical protein